MNMVLIQMWGVVIKKICIDELDYSEQVAKKIYKLRCSFLHENSTYENKGLLT